jgi:hypothetical protein
MDCFSRHEFSPIGPVALFPHAEHTFFRMFESEFAGSVIGQRPLHYNLLRSASVPHWVLRTHHLFVPRTPR